MGTLRKLRGKLTYSPETTEETNAFNQLGPEGMKVSLSGEGATRRRRKRGKLDESPEVEADEAEVSDEGSAESQPDRRATADEHGKGHPPQTETDMLRAPEAGQQGQPEKAGQNEFVTSAEAFAKFDHNGDGRPGGSRPRKKAESTK